ncbi:hypothetical protein CEXT_602901 [Caerostris extrusa]|uniref:Uncharacterized protein n=1 Tax=Caerostris extrusa TaxID=172846 RepID=A0AAV4R3N1_CAEEX|nr:hypothetical protein CEXT_602901 [Caerostris extrusa]
MNHKHILKKNKSGLIKGANECGGTLKKRLLNAVDDYVFAFLMRPSISIKREPRGYSKPQLWAASARQRGHSREGLPRRSVTIRKGFASSKPSRHRCGV